MYSCTAEQGKGQKRGVDCRNPIAGHLIFNDTLVFRDSGNPESIRSGLRYTACHNNVPKKELRHKGLVQKNVPESGRFFDNAHKNRSGTIWLSQQAIGMAATAILSAGRNGKPRFSAPNDSTRHKPIRQPDRDAERLCKIGF